MDHIEVGTIEITCDKLRLVDPINSDVSNKCVVNDVKQGKWKVITSHADIEETELVLAKLTMVHEDDIQGVPIDEDQSYTINYGGDGYMGVVPDNMATKVVEDTIIMSVAEKGAFVCAFGAFVPGDPEGGQSIVEVIRESESKKAIKLTIHVIAE